MFKLAVIGLDTSHSVAFPKLIQGETEKVVDDLQVISCMRFESAFQSEEGQDKRQAELEKLNIEVTRSLEDAVAGVDGLLLEINDPALHLEYFEKVADLGLPVFLDKPMADTLANGMKIYNMARDKELKVWSSSSLRFTPDIVACAKAVPRPRLAHAYGPLGKAASGNSLVWYGVHTFEMIMTLMGRGARKVFAREDPCGVVSIVEYGDGRRAVAECNTACRKYGGDAQNEQTASNFINSGSPYTSLMSALHEFFIGGTIPVSLEETVEVQAVMDAAVASLQSGATEAVAAPQSP